MAGSEFLVVVFMGASMLAGVIIGMLMIGNSLARAYGALLAGHVFAILGIWIEIREGISGRGQFYAMALFLLILPSFIGMLMGGGFAFWRKRRQKP